MSARRPTRDAKSARALLERVSPILVEGRRKSNLLDVIAWPRDVEERFFEGGADRLPEISYSVDRDGLEAQVKDLSRARSGIEGDDAIAVWLRDCLQSQIDMMRLLLALGTKSFGERSRELYGGARSRFYSGRATNLDLAEHLLDRLSVHGWDEARDRDEEPIGASEFVEDLQARIDRRRPRLDVSVVLDPGSGAKAVAGMRKVKVRPDATFSSWEADGLYYHEVETHALTAHNGAAQPELPFLSSGGPRTTLTQEGLAVFSELENRVLGAERLERLAIRVKLVAMAEEGATFLDLYRFLLQRGSAPRDAYFDAQRICRGGLVTGGAPFSKDACYLAGLLHVHAFLAAFVRGGFRDETELLVCGRIALDDVAALAELRALGILARPKHRPRWLKRWNTLLPYFAFSSFLDTLDLDPVEAHYREVIEFAKGR
jgi:uncharacterized protein (TIGR02421 family)